MKIARVHIENYRSIKQLDFSPNNYCALIGENNAGKSNILKAINLVLGETWPTDRTFTEEDFNDYNTENDIVIQIYFDSTIDEWRNNCKCEIAGFELRGKAYKRRVKSKPAGTLVVDFVCIDKKGRPCQYPATPYKEGERYTGQYYQLKVSKELRERVPFIYVDVMRDYNKQDPSNRWSILRRLFNDINTSLSSDKTTVNVETSAGKKKMTRKQAFELKIKEAYSFLQTEQFIEIESNGHFFHLFLTHTIRFEAHILRSNIDQRRLIQHVNLIKSLHSIAVYGKNTVFFPHDYIIVLQFLDSGFRQLYRTRQFIRNDTQTSRTERLRFGNHTP